MEQRDVWEGVGRVAKGWVPLHGSGTVGEASHSAASSLTCPRVRAKASMSRPYQLISEPMEAFPPTLRAERRAYSCFLLFPAHDAGSPLFRATRSDRLLLALAIFQTKGKKSLSRLPRKNRHASK